MPLYPGLQYQSTLLPSPGLVTVIIVLQQTCRWISLADLTIYELLFVESSGVVIIKCYVCRFRLTEMVDDRAWT
jgi:hypothetical protein